MFSPIKISNHSSIVSSKYIKMFILYKVNKIPFAFISDHTLWTTQPSFDIFSLANCHGKSFRVMDQHWVIATGLGFASARNFLEEEKKILINSKPEWEAWYDRAVTKSAKSTHLMLNKILYFSDTVDCRNSLSSISDEGCGKEWYVLISIYFQIMSLCYCYFWQIIFHISLCQKYVCRAL